ncbi:Eco57I restriction-modification methylase domain-containing protein [Flavobacterium inviolabile]|uniref:Eco57I restriction-modification methylase domain-containing protein n=1 Tax=Flavobacterium inviolabile TaxID=2748320 RepID=UPI0015AB8BA7|nr:N-6 DNA methylase [Flavobacterium inviolabile]
MSLYQESVLISYLKLQDNEVIAKAYKKYAKYFLNAKIQENIKRSKEEQFQAIFLTELFVNVLGYVINPNPSFNLTTEFKNQKNAGKADGAIIKNGAAIGVIELKGTKTKDLESIRKQAFDYKSNQKGCTYIITSNFEKLRFYINDATEYEEFNLFSLTEERFSIMYLCLAKSNVFNNIPLRLMQDSITEEKKITKRFYDDYSLFKRELFRDLVKRNTKRFKHFREENREVFDKEFELEFSSFEKNLKLSLFKKSQKLIDRFLFIFFAEDRGLLLPNTTKKIVNDWNKLKELDAKVSLYDRFKLFFDYLDKGRKQTDGKDEVFAYNGGLFKPDFILEYLEIDDDLLDKYTLKLSEYNFRSQVDVNILGHIFENSLNEIESINAEIIGGQFDKQKSKRKNDGVFYTPKYITKFIVDSTLGKLCNDKKNELNFREEEYFKSRKSRKETILQALLDILSEYREWLLDIKICDPACGSGAFLNQALEFLIKEHRYIDELKANLLGGALVFSDIENQVLERNIFGVDLNDESVEIAKLSLWLRTAQPKRKLNDLSNNIRCGNSLISNKTLGGEKAFKWSEMFPEILNDKKGFDVIIGNPPYGAKLDQQTQSYLNKTFISGGSETVISFLKLSYDLLKEGGHLGFIIPKSFSFSSNYKPIREFLVNDITEIVDCSKVWNEVKLEQVIVEFTKSINSESYTSSIRNNQEISKIGEISKTTFREFGFLLNGIATEELKIGKKMIRKVQFLNDISINQRGGSFQSQVSEEGDTFVLGGANIQREGLRGYKGKINYSVIQNDKKNFINPNSVLVQNIVSHIQNPVEHIKIISCSPDGAKDKYSILDTINQLTIKEDFNSKVISALLNSKIINWFAYRFIFGKAIRTMHFDNAITQRIPIPKIDKKSNDELLKLIENQKLIINEISMTQKNFIKYFSKLLFKNEQLTSNLIKWDESDFKAFIKNVNANRNKKLTADEEYKWFELFSGRINEINELKSKKNTIQNEIDIIFCNLFTLNENEVKLVIDN